MPTAPSTYKSSDLNTLLYTIMAVNREKRNSHSDSVILFFINKNILVPLKWRARCGEIVAASATVHFFMVNNKYLLS